MPVALTALLFVFWIYLAYRELQRGNMPLAALFLVIGIALSIYRLRARR